MTPTRLWKLYHLRPEEAARILNYQKNHSPYHLLLGKRLGLDHNHKTGQIRGYLDWRINRALGLIEAATPNVYDTILALAWYIQNPPSEEVLFGRRYGLIGRAQYKHKMVYGPPKESHEH
jgi:hypothetical protein